MLSMYNKLVLDILGVMPDNTLTFTNEVSGMSTSDYTQAQIKALQAKPVTLAIAKQFAADWNKSVKSIVAKSVSMGVYGAPSTPSPEGAGVGHKMASVTK